MKLSFRFTILFISCLGAFAQDMILMQHPDVYQFFDETAPTYDTYESERFGNLSKDLKKKTCETTAGLTTFISVPEGNPFPSSKPISEDQQKLQENIENTRDLYDTVLVDTLNYMGVNTDQKFEEFKELQGIPCIIRPDEVTFIENGVNSNRYFVLSRRRWDEKTSSESMELFAKPLEGDAQKGLDVNEPAQDLQKDEQGDDIIQKSTPLDGNLTAPAQESPKEGTDARDNKGPADEIPQEKEKASDVKGPAYEVPQEGKLSGEIKEPVQENLREGKPGNDDTGSAPKVSHEIIQGDEIKVQENVQENIPNDNVKKPIPKGPQGTDHESILDIALKGLMEFNAGDATETMGLVERSIEVDKTLTKRRTLETYFLKTHVDEIDIPELKKIIEENKQSSEQSDHNISEGSSSATPEASVNLCDADELTRFRICSSIFSAWSMRKNRHVERVNYIRRGNADCLKDAAIFFKRFPGKFSITDVHNMIPCAINVGWATPQFYVVADKREADMSISAYIVERKIEDIDTGNKPYYRLEMRVKNLPAFNNKKEVPVGNDINDVPTEAFTELRRKKLPESMLPTSM